MARLFDNNAANYMVRSSVSLGLNGATECSFACWVKLTATDLVNSQRLIVKGIADGWKSFGMLVVSSTNQINWGVESQALNDFPTIITTGGISVGVWTRILCTFKRSAGATSADFATYFNGQAVGFSFTANGYTNTFTIEESASTDYLFGVRPFTITTPLNGALAWACVWNRQLSAQEALIDYTNPRNVTSGLISRVPIGDSDKDDAFGGSMTVTGTLRNITGSEPIYGSDSFAIPVRPRAFAPGLAR